MEINLKAKIKEISIKNLVSGDKGIRFLLVADDIGNAFKLAELEEGEMIWIKFGKDKFMAMVIQVSKKIGKKFERVQILIEAAPAEVFNAVVFAGLPVDAEVEVDWHKS